MLHRSIVVAMANATFLRIRSTDLEHQVRSHLALFGRFGLADAFMMDVLAGSKALESESLVSWPVRHDSPSGNWEPDLGARSRPLNRRRASANLVETQAHKCSGLGKRCGHMADSYGTMVCRTL